MQLQALGVRFTLRSTLIYEGVMLKSLAEHNANRRKAHEPDNGPVKNGIACPKCGAELMDSDPAMLLTSNPPQKRTHCSECDYTGYRVA